MIVVNARLLFLVSLLALIFFAIPSFAATITVPGDYSTIQEAIDHASSGDTVQVGPNTYTISELSLPSNSNITITSEDGPAQTILKSASGDPIIDYQEEQSSASVFSGFTIENVSGEEGAMDIIDASPTIENCIFENCATDGESGGGAIYITDNTISGEGYTMSPTIEDCEFIGCAATSATEGSPQAFGGAIEAEQSGAGTCDVAITNCVFIDNSASYDGGAIDVDGYNGASPALTVTNCSFTGNTAQGNSDGTLTVPSASAKPGAIDEAEGVMTLVNCVLYGDSGSTVTNGVSSTEISTLDPGATAKYSDVEGGFSGTGNINSNPLYINAASDNLNIEATSPVIDVADAALQPSEDIVGNSRSSSPDMGAYEYIAFVTADSQEGTENTALTGVTVAGITDTAGETAATSVFAATINWGDGTGTSGGTVTQPGGTGTAYVVTGSHTYTTAGAFTITVSVTVDSRSPIYSGTNTATIAATAPTANGQDDGVDFNTPTVIILTGTDSNAGTLSYSLASSPTQGTLSSITQTNHVTYTPTTNHHGADSFTFTVTNGTTGKTSSAATVNLTIAPGVPTATAQGPVAVPFNTATSITLSGTDPDVSPTLSLTYVAASPAHGSLSGTAPNLTYTPTSGYSGADSFTFTVSNGTNTSAPATVTLTVAASPVATHFVVSAPASATAGTSFSSVTVTAETASNTVATGYTGTVHFTSTDAGVGVVLPANATLTNGTGTFSATLVTAGSQTITATDTVTTSISGTSNSITVSPGAATHFTVSAPASATAGTSFLITITAKDASNNTATGYTGTVHFTSTDTGTGVALPANSTLTNGTGEFLATLVTAGSQTITATDTVTTSITGTSSSITVDPGAATHFVVSAPASATAGVSFSNVTITAKDAHNNVATGYSGTVHFTSTDAGVGVVLPANTTLTNGTGTFSATLVTVGSQTITATDTVTTSITGTSNSIMVSAGAATHFVVSAPASATAGVSFSNLTVTAKDAYNNTATGYTGTVHFTSSDSGTGVVLPANATLTNGTGTFSATLVTAGSQTITATDTVTTSITGTSNSIAVGASAAASLIVNAPRSASTGAPFNITVTAFDQYGNVATGYAGTVQFTSTDTKATLPANTTLSSGVGNFSATLGTLGTQTITATDTVTSSLTGTSGSIDVSVGTATNFIVSAPSTATAGTAFNVTVTAYDGYNNVVTNYPGTVQFTSTDGAAVLPGNSTLVNGVGNFSATLNTAGGQTITATDTVTSSITGTSGSITVGAATGTPTANPQPAVSTNENTAVNITLTGSDPDSPPLALTYAVATGPTNGTLSGSGANLIYTPNAGFTGSDSFTFTASNGVNTSTPATISITVNQVATDVSAQVTVSLGGLRLNPVLHLYGETVTLTNNGGAITGPISLVIGNLSSNASVANPTGTTSAVTPSGRPYVNVSGLAAGATETVPLQFVDSTNTPISYTTQVLAGPGLR